MWKQAPVATALRLASRRALSTSVVVPRRAVAVPRFASPVQAWHARFYSPLCIDKPAKLYVFEDVKKIIDQPTHPDVVLIDVREPHEFKDGHIPGSLNIPYKSSPGALGLDREEFLDQFGFEKPELDKRLVFYCLGGVRSTAAEGIAATYGYQCRSNYTGSYEDWLKNNGKTEV